MEDYENPHRAAVEAYHKHLLAASRVFDAAHASGNKEAKDAAFAAFMAVQETAPPLKIISDEEWSHLIDEDQWGGDW